jgi:hypothetical protein
MEGEKSVSKEKKFSLESGLKIMELVTQVAVARERNEADTRVLGDVNALIRTLFSTMCEVLPPQGKIHVSRI